MLTDLLTYELRATALAQTGHDTTRTEIVLASPSGSTDVTRTLTQEHGNVRLLTDDEILTHPWYKRCPPGGVAASLR